MKGGGLAFVPFKGFKNGDKCGGSYIILQEGTVWGEKRIREEKGERNAPGARESIGVLRR
jgi:hypothetical protein